MANQAGPNISGAGRSRTARGMLAVAAIACGALLATVASGEAGWLSRFGRAGELSTPMSAVSALEHAAAHVKSLTVAKSGGTAIAAQATAEGHWTLVSRSGETFTSANAAEFARGIQLLAPEIAAAEGKLALYLTEDSVFAGRIGLKDLPKSAAVYMVRDKDAYRLIRRNDGSSLFAEVRPGLVVEITERLLFDEALYQLARPVNRSGVRVLSLEPGGPASLSSVPRFEPSGTRALVDMIDPARFADALPRLKGQTALITGRVDGDTLFLQAAGSTERGVKLRELIAAAEAADVNLIVLRATSSRQPGGRNWLWQTVEVRGLDDALKSATMSDFLASLGNGRAPFAVTVSQSGAGQIGVLRTSLDLVPVRDVTSAMPTVAEVSGKLTELAGSVTGHVAIQAVSAHVRSSERQSELDRRIVPGVPSWAQGVYAMALFLGFFGATVSARWWARIWPPENRAEYGNGFGYWAARSIRGSLFYLVFMPLSGPLSAALAALQRLRTAALVPMRWWHQTRGS